MIISSLRKYGHLKKASVIHSVLFTQSFASRYLSTGSRQKKVLESAKRSTAIIKSLFPTGIRNRLLDEARSNNRFEKMLPEDYAMMETPKLRLQSYLEPSASKLPLSRRTAAAGILGSEPIAEFFPAATIMFADLSGYVAAWACVYFVGLFRNCTNRTFVFHFFVVLLLGPQPVNQLKYLCCWKHCMGLWTRQPGNLTFSNWRRSATAMLLQPVGFT